MKRCFTVIVAVLVGCLFLAASRSSQRDLSANDIAAIRAQLARYNSTALAHDFDAWGNTLAADVVLMPPNQAPVFGRTAAVAFGNAFPKLSAFTYTVDEIVGRGDLAYVRGTYSLAGTLSDGTGFSQAGSYLGVHRRSSDGTWPYARLIW